MQLSFGSPPQGSAVRKGGEGSLKVGEGPVRTGVTVIALPHDKRQKVLKKYNR
jgi:hypothetical protein